MIDAFPPSVRVRDTLARAVSPPPIDREALKARYDAIFATTVPPFAFVDLDALARNARRMLDQAGGLPIRIASKSVRSTAVLRRILELDPGFRGVHAFTVPEALYLAEQGFDDIVVAYPSVDRAAIARVARLEAERPKARAGADGRRPPPPRPDRGGDRRRPRAGPRLPRHRRRLVAARRADGADRAEALAGPRRRPRRAGWRRRSPSAPAPRSPG